LTYSPLDVLKQTTEVSKNLVENVVYVRPSAEDHSTEANAVFGTPVSTCIAPFCGQKLQQSVKPFDKSPFPSNGATFTAPSKSNQLLTAG
jgi:hypothetical protein